MFYELFAQNKKLVILLLSIVVVGLVGFGYYRFFVFQLVSIDPPNNGVVTDGTKTLHFTYNKSLDVIDQSTQLIASDDKIIGGFQVDDTVIDIQLTGLELDHTYSITLLNVSSLNNDKIPSYTYTFTYKYIPFNKLSTQDQANQTTSTDRGNISDPVIKALPASSSHYYINYTLHDKKDAKGKNESLSIALLLTNQELSDSVKMGSYKREAIAFLKDQGINVADYIVSWAPEQAAGL